MREKRVKLADYGRVHTDDRRLVPVASVPGRKKQRLHWAGAQAFEKLRRAAMQAGYDLRIVSGWRPHRWRDREHYNRTLITRYGSVKEGRRWLAYDSPHETGLVFDLGTHGLSASSKSAGYQRTLPVYHWLVANAAKYGITPYKLEPWHWEVKVPRWKWQSPIAVNTKILALMAVGFSTAWWIYAR